MKPGYRTFDHTADIGIEASGRNLNELFANAAKALFDVAVDLKSIRASEEETIDLEAEEASLLLHAWLSELLFRFTARARVYSVFQFEFIGPTRLSAKVKGEKFENDQHHLKTDIKAVTYHGLKVAKTKRGWMCRVILDL